MYNSISHILILDYHSWHRNITRQISHPNMTTYQQQINRLLELDVRFLLYARHRSGYADRILHFISTYLVALLTHRYFVFDQNWPAFLKVMKSNLNYEYNLVIPWYSQLNKLTRKTRNQLSVQYQWFSLERFTKDYDYENKNRILVFGGHTGTTVHTITSPTSIYRSFLTNTLKMTGDTLFGCLYHSLIIPRLSTFVQIASAQSSSQFKGGQTHQQLLQTLLSTTHNSVAIQIRTGDEIMKNPHRMYSLMYKFQIYFDCAKEISQGKPTIVYLMADDYRIRQAALKTYSNTQFSVIANPHPVQHIQYTQNLVQALNSLLFDTFLFMFCERHIITSESGFGRFAAFASLKQKDIYSFDVGEVKTWRCEEKDNRALSLTEAGHRWSGVRRKR
ncbi:unnamed protein product [Didymodactylos carnosus]|uniref:Uncharacterized protein n=1 Tax=Didymodactylos carnosus TaxID=1234261 RepID=A0A815JQR8_9BILA|nr:unnamed protein product [Didymodactylos carnosus]CAF1384672.1 unnamed protein product [Didymodactylos carnosus]CAF4178234.1 unnamed protein product [Didymodactylos carnosus]CAF4279878.1 unnamed protein product [Didymodactylos carnosus]